jgi:hypothetical protein
MTACECPPPRRPVPSGAVPAIVADLASVGGAYEYVAAAVEHQGGHREPSLFALARLTPTERLLRVLGKRDTPHGG